MRVTFSDVVPADKDALFEWWTDYSADDHAHFTIPRVYRMHRRIVSRDDDRIELEDQEVLFGSRTTTRSLVKLHERERVEVEAVTPYGVQRQTYWFEEMPGGAARITHTMEIDPVGMWARIERAITPIVRWGSAWDMRRHLDLFLRQYRAHTVGEEPMGHPTVWGAVQYGR